MLRVPVLSPEGKPLMPTKPSRARRWMKEGKAIKQFNKLGQFYVQLVIEPSDRKTQPIAVGLDPGKYFSGIGIQSAKFTLFTAHLQSPFKKVRERMDNRRMMRRGRRGRRINRQIPFHLRAHRQKRFSNRKQGKIPPSIKANRQLELRVIQELCKVFPVTDIYFEYVKANVSLGARSLAPYEGAGLHRDLTSRRKGASSGKGFSVVMVGQKWMLKQLEKLGNVHTIYGWQTSNLRKHLGLEKSKDKAEQTASSHAVDGVTLACYQFLEYKSDHSVNNHGHSWQGNVTITFCQFMVIKRPPISRRQLHLMLPSKGGERRKYGGTVTRHGIRKGDFVKAEKAGKVFYGWCSGDTAKQVSVSDFCWKRLGQFTASKVLLLQRSTGLICKQGTDFVGATIC